MEPSSYPSAGATARQGLAAAAPRLAAVSDTPRLDAELLMAHALGIEREAMLLGRLDAPVPEAFEPLVARRLVHEPVAYITGWRDFWTLRLRVTPDVLIPRPDSETLIEAAIEAFADRQPRRILDLGTGSGALLLAALSHWPGATGLGIDASRAALVVAADNASRLGLATRADVRHGDWGSGVGERFDLVLCNPPYVESGAALPPTVRDHEPASAIFAGADGLDAYRRIGGAIPELLAPGGIACLEMDAGQATSVRQLLPIGTSSDVRRDLAGRPRCLVINA